MKNRVIGFLMSLMMIICCLPTNILSLFAYADTTTDEEEFNLDTEIFNFETGEFNKKAIDTILTLFTSEMQDGTEVDAEYKVDAFYNAATLTRNYEEMIKRLQFEDINFKLAFTIGGLKWVPTYLSTDKDGNAVVTFWLSESSQEAWASYENGHEIEEGSNVSFYNGSLYSTYSLDENYMYGTSSVRAYALNNSSENIYNGADENGDPIYTSYTAKSDHPFAAFTMPESKLTDYIVKPSEMAWQEYQAPDISLNGSLNFEGLNYADAMAKIMRNLLGVWDDELTLNILNMYCQSLTQSVMTPVNEGWSADLVNAANQTKIEEVLAIYFEILDTLKNEMIAEREGLLQEEQNYQNNLTIINQTIESATQTIALCDANIAEAEERIANATSDEDRIAAEEDKQEAENQKAEAQATKTQAEAEKVTVESNLQTTQSSLQNINTEIENNAIMKAEGQAAFEIFSPYVAVDKHGNYYNFYNNGGLNYQDEPYYSSWKDDYLWLPSMSEIGLMPMGFSGLWGGGELLLSNSDVIIEDGLNYSNNTMVRSAGLGGFVSVFQDVSNFSFISNGTLQSPGTACAVRPAFNLNLTKIIKEQELEKEHSRYVYIDEIWNEDTQSFNNENLLSLYENITGFENANVNNIKTLLNDNGGVFSANDIKGIALSNSNKTAGKDIIVRIGGLDWHVTYLSNNKDEEPILTVWLSNSFQNKHSYYKDFLTGNLNGRMAGTLISMSNGTSLYSGTAIRSVGLNNSGKYYLGNIDSKTATIDADGYVDYTATINHPLAMYTMQEFGFTKYLATPREMAWQEYQSFYAISPNDACFSNDAWSDEITETTEGYFFNETATNYANQKYNSAWADDYLWLPSATEIVNYTYNNGDGEETLMGLWELATNQLQNYDGVSSQKVVSLGPDDSGMPTPTSYYIRSGAAANGNILVSVNANGSSFSMTDEMELGCVRPAMHLNLSSMPTLDTSGLVLRSNINYYNGSSQVDNLVFAYDNEQLNLGDDYNIVIYSKGEEVTDIINVGTYNITFTGIGDYAFIGDMEFTYSVEAVNLSTRANINFTEIPEFVEGETTEVIPTVEITYNGNTLISGVDYDITYSNNTSATNKAEYKVVYKGNYTGQTEGSFVIPYVDLSTATIYCAINGTSYAYDGLIHKHTPGNVYANGVLLVEGVDYDWMYWCFDENDQPIEDIPDSFFINPGAKIIILQGKGNYSGAALIRYTIDDIDVSHLTIVPNIGTYTYNGAEHRPVPTISYQGTTLVSGTDYEVYYYNNIDASTNAEMQIYFKGIYGGNYSATYTINPKDINSVIVQDLQEYTYNTYDQYVNFTLYDEEIGDSLLKATGNSPDDNDDYWVVDNKVRYAKTYSIVCRGNGNYTGSKTVQVVVKKAAVVDVELVNMSGGPAGPSNAYYKQTRFASSNSLDSKDVMIRCYILDSSGEKQSVGFKTFYYGYRAYRNGQPTTDLENIGQIDFEIYDIEDNDVYLPSGTIFNASYTIYPDIIRTVTPSYTGQAYMAFYNRRAHEVSVTVGSLYTEVLDPSDYLVSYYKYDAATETYGTTPTTMLEAGQYKWVVTSNNENYVLNGEASGTAYILPKSVTELLQEYYYIDAEGNFTDASGNITSDKVYVAAYTGKYTGLPLDVDLFFDSSKAYELTRETEYTITKDKSKLESEGKYIITITGVGNYYNTLTIDFNVNQYRIQSMTSRFTTTIYYNYGDPVEIDPENLVITNPELGVDLVYGQDYVYFTGEYGTTQVDKYSNNINTGTAYLYIQGLGDYVGVSRLSFTINTRGVNDADVVSGFSVVEEQYSYTKKEITPIISHPRLLENRDYTVKYYDNRAVGTAKIVITGINNFDSVRFIYFEIVKKSIEDEDIGFGDDVETTIAYTGNLADITNSIVLHYFSQSIDLVSGSDYNVYYYKDGQETDSADVGEVTMEFNGKNSFVGTRTLQLTIVSKSIEDDSVSKDIKETYTYQNGYAFDYGLVNGSEALVEGRDYTASYKKDGQDTELNSTGNFDFTITGINNYSGSLTGSFTVEKGVITSFEETSYVFTYNRRAHSLELKVKDSFGVNINEDEYILTYFVWDEDNEAYVSINASNIDYISPGKYLVSAQVNPEKDNYTGTCAATFEIERKSIQELFGSDETDDLFKDMEFTNKDIEQEIEIKFEDYGLIKGVDYNIRFENNKNTGTADVIIEGIGNYGGSVNSSFEIVEKPIDEIETPEGSTLADLVIVKEYTGSQISLEDSDFIGLISYGDGYLVAGTDFVYEYLDDERVEIGDYRVILTGSGNYCGTVEITMRISAIDFSALTIDPIADQKYVGDEIIPTIVFKLNDAAASLIEGEDYNITFENNVAVGTATIRVTGIGYYKGEYTTTFNIIPVTLDDTSINVEYQNEFAYDSRLKNPALKMKYETGKESLVLIKTTDFNSNVYLDVNRNKTYESAIDTLFDQPIYDANDYLIVVDGVGNYGGRLVLPVKVTKLNVSSAVYSEFMSIVGIAQSYTYTGSAITPEVRFVSSYIDISMDDFEVIYGENTNVATGGTITLRAVENSNFIGEHQFPFEIAKADLVVLVELKNKNKTLYVGDKLPEIIVTNDIGVVGTLTYDCSKDSLSLGKKSYDWVFTPEDTANYNIAYGTIIISAQEKKDSPILFIILGIILLLIIIAVVITILIIKKKRKNQV